MLAKGFCDLRMQCQIASHRLHPHAVLYAVSLQGSAVPGWRGCLQGCLPALQDDFEVCLDDDAMPSATPVRQLRSPAERSPSAKAAAMVADRLQSSQEGAGLKVSTFQSSKL